MFNNNNRVRHKLVALSTTCNLIKQHNVTTFVFEGLLKKIGKYLPIEIGTCKLGCKEGEIDEC